ncbi:hypothetical protein HOLleu_11388 [Holothuria leucospilota]|uniref:Uncharacterized protein n=1 Tax=Holothuria leucospilota TaxID=206669 RepID=A0A9Q1CEU9_HOLLE|nr:hypothetical protein HOLleu_11388 [Holothuria leucospilota]
MYMHYGKRKNSIVLMEVKGHLGSKSKILRIPKIVSWVHQKAKSKFSQEFPRSSS